jgi:hypothetical protein
VRNALLGSGLTTGLRRAEAEREPVEVDATPAPREDAAWTILTDAGFQFIGEWTQDPESQISLDTKAPTVPGVYAFIVDDIVVYFGLTLNTLRTRLDQYRRGNKSQKTPSRLNWLKEEYGLKVELTWRCCGWCWSIWRDDGPPANTQIWIAAGVTDLRRGFTGLSALVQTKLEKSPISGQVSYL